MKNGDFKNAFPHAPEHFKNKVEVTLNNLPDKKEKGGFFMVLKKAFGTKVAAIVAAVLVVGSTSYGIGTWYYTTGSSFKISDSFPSKQKLNNEFGYAPKLVKKFDNGFVFKEYDKDKQRKKDKHNNVISKSESPIFKYVKGKNILDISVDNDKVNYKNDIKNNKNITQYDKFNDIKRYKHINIYYQLYNYKLVPDGYNKTEQDKKDEKCGKLMIGYGDADKVKFSKDIQINWKDHGLNYHMLFENSNLNKSDLLKMVHEVIDQK